MPPVIEDQKDVLHVDGIYLAIRRIKRSSAIPTWGDAVVWGELYREDKYPSYLGLGKHVFCPISLFNM